MPPRRRTLCLIVTLLSFNNGLVLVASVDVGPVLTNYPSSSLPTPQLTNPFLPVASANRVLPESLPVAQKTFPNPRLGFNNAFPCGSFPQGISSKSVPTSHYANPNVLTTYSTYIPPAENFNSLPIVDKVADSFHSSDLESLTITENHPPVTQAVQVDIERNFFDFPKANEADVYRTPITAQMSPTPQVLQTPQLTNSFISVASVNRVLPESLPVAQNIFPNPQVGLNAFPCGSYPQDISANTVSTAYYASPNVFTSYATYKTPVDSSNPLPIVENHPAITQSVQVAVERNSFDFPTANVAEIYQTPVTVQMPSTPQVLQTPQLTNSFLAVASANRVLPGSLLVAQNIFPYPRLDLNAFPCGSYQQDISPNTFSTSYCASPNVFTPYATYIAPVETSNPLPIVEQISDTFYPPDIETLTIVENHPPITQTVQVEVDDNCFDFPTANVVDICQTPVTLEMPSTPQVSPFISVAPSLPEILPAQNYVQEICTQTVETSTPVPIETATITVPSNDVGCYCQPCPVTLQVNMPSPWIEPVVAILPPPQPAPCSYPSFEPSFGMSPAPIIVMEQSNSKWKNILPILMLTLFDCGCGNCGGGGCGNYGGGGCSSSQCSKSIPVPFPIVIPVNNPIITSGSRSARGKGTKKPPSDVEE